MPVKRLQLESNMPELRQAITVNSGPWTVMPNPAKSRSRTFTHQLTMPSVSSNHTGAFNHVNCFDNVIVDNRNMAEDREIVEVSARESGKFEDVEMDEAAQLELEITSMEKQLAQRKLAELRHRKEELQKELQPLKWKASKRKSDGKMSNNKMSKENNEGDSWSECGDNSGFGEMDRHDAWLQKSENLPFI